MIDRRRFFGAAAGGAAVGLAGPALAQAGAPDFTAAEAALAEFAALDGMTGYVVDVGGDNPWRAEHQPDAPLFVGSAIKTFILTRFLKDVEEGRLDLDDQLAVDDGVRSLSSPVFLNLTGTTPGRSVLEAMITHSDNTATDIAMAAVGVDRVRAFAAEAGLATARIPTSTRVLFSYLAGAEPGVDIGWEGMRGIADDVLPGAARNAMDPDAAESMLCSAADLVSYYRRAVAGEFFSTPAMLTEFLRVSAMANAMPLVVPHYVAAYGKGGSIEWNNFNALCVPGEMWVRASIPVTFCFTLNWNGDPSTIPGMAQAFVAAAGGVLSAINTALAEPPS